MKNPNRPYDIAFLFLLALAFLFTLPFHRGLLLGDDYLGAANQLLKGNWDIENNFLAHRIGACLPYAIGIAIGGLGTWLNYITTCEFLLLMVVVYAVLRKADAAIALMTAFFLCVSTSLHRNAGIVMSDIAATLMVNAVILAYFYYSFYITKKERTAKTWGIIIALLVSFSFLVKESFVFYFPVLLWLYWNDRKQPHQKAAGKFFLFFFIGFVGAMGAIYWLKTGDALFRLRAVEVTASYSNYNYSKADWITILNRITWQPFQFLAEKFSFGSLLLFSVLQLVLPSNKPIEKFHKIYLAGTLGFWWAGSQGFTGFNPVGFVERLWIPLLVPLAINSSFFLKHAVQGDIKGRDRKKISIAAILFLLASAISLYSSSRLYALHPELPNQFLLNIQAWYFILVVSILLTIHFDKIFERAPASRYFLLFIVAFPFIKGGFQQVFIWRDRESKGIRYEYDSEKEMMKYAISLKPRLLLTDFRVARFYYIYILNLDTKLPIADYNDVALDSLGRGDYLLLNPERQLWLEKSVTETYTYTKADYVIAAFVNNPEQNGFTLIKENETNRLYRYEGK